MTDLTYTNYKSLITALKKDYTFTCFSKIKYSNELVQKKILLRHDIDLSLEKALEMAEKDPNILARSHTAWKASK